MNRRRWVLLLTLIFVLCANGTFSSQSTEDWEWVNKHFDETLDSLMPLGSAAGYYVVYRAHRDYRTDVPEYWFKIGYDANTAGYGLQPFLSAHVSVADSSSIYEQLMRMHRANEQENAVSMTTKIKLKRWDINEASCFSIKKQIADLQQLQFKPSTLTPNHIVLHPMNHEFHIDAPDGDLNFVIWNDEHPLVRWALETRRVLESCPRTKYRL